MRVNLCSRGTFDRVRDASKRCVQLRGSEGVAECTHSVATDLCHVTQALRVPRVRAEEHCEDVYGIPSI